MAKKKPASKKHPSQQQVYSGGNKAQVSPLVGDMINNMNGEISVSKQDLFSAQNFMLYSQQQQQQQQQKQQSVSNRSYFDYNSSADLTSSNNMISYLGATHSNSNTASTNKFATDLRHCFSLRKHSVHAAPVALTVAAAASSSTASSDIYTDYEERQLLSKQPANHKGIVCMTDGASTSFKFVRNGDSHAHSHHETTNSINHTNHDVNENNFYFNNKNNNNDNHSNNENNNNNNNKNGHYPQIKYVFLFFWGIFWF